MTLGADRLVRDEKRVENAISQTAKTAQKGEGKTQRWMERHKTALTAIGAATAGATAGIIAASPDLQGALGEIYLNFSMLAMSIGEDWAPAFEWLADVTEGLADAYESLPEPIQDVIAGALGLGAVLLIGAGAVAGLTWLLGPLTGALGLTGAAASGTGASAAVGAGGLGLLSLAAVGLAAALVFCGVAFVLWKTGVIAAVEDAGTVSGQFLVDTTVRFWNWVDKIGAGLKLLKLYGIKYGTEFNLAVSNALTDLPLIGGFFQDSASAHQASLENINEQIAEQKAIWNKDPNEGVPQWAPIDDETPGHHPVSGWFDSLCASSGSDELAAEQARLDELWASAMPEDYQDQIAALDDLQVKIAEFQESAGTGTGETAQSFADAMTIMDSSASTAGTSIETTAKTLNTKVSAEFQDLNAKSPIWGSDLMSNFLSGLDSKMPALEAKLSTIRSMIESALSFDIPRNDRMAMRWGEDLVSYFDEGMAMAAPRMTVPVPAPMPAAAASSTTYSTPVQVTVNVTGTQAKDFDERKLAQYVRDEVGNALRGRGR